MDILFIGGALYAYGLDSHLKDYLKTLKKGDAKRAVVFSTSWISKHSIELIKKGLLDAGIPSFEESLREQAKSVPDAMQGCIPLPEEDLLCLKELLTRALAGMDMKQRLMKAT